MHHSSWLPLTCTQFAYCPEAFSFFDAAHTDGYVATAVSKKDVDNQLTSDRRFFTDEEDEEDIVTKIHKWKQGTEAAAKPQLPERDARMHALFAEPLAEETLSNQHDKSPTKTDDIQLNRLLDDYMLGSKGDRIMKQMEELTMDGRSSSTPTENEKSEPAKNLFSDPDEEEDNAASLLTDMVSMEDFEKYIAEN